MDIRTVRRQRILTLIPLLAAAVMIFCFSAQDSLRSSTQSTGVTAMLLRIFVRNFNSLGADAQAELLRNVGAVIRKLAHFTEFFLFGFFLRLHLTTYALKRPFPAALLIGALYAASDELHQLFVPGRACQLKDVLIDTFGIFFGILLLAFLRKCAKRKRSK